MNYNETLSYLYNSTPVFQHVGGSAYKPGLDNSLALDAYLDHPHRKYKTIHVGGTNGKGSTSHLIASILQQSGYRVGLYTSPHLVDFRERIRVDGRMIPEEEVVSFVALHKMFFEELKPSFFELTMMMAFDYFARCQVDMAVIEVGLGGRLDSTNIITPVLSVITNISFDHTQFLGDTLEKIAAEKAGIIKSGVPVVIGESTGTVREVFRQKADEVQTRIIFADDERLIPEATVLPDGQWLFQAEGYPGLIGALGGSVQQKNANTVLCALREIRKIYPVPDHAVYEGFDKVIELTGLQGRWQIVNTSPKVVLDTGHNEAGISQIVSQLKQEKYHRLHIVFGTVKDKDITSMLNLLPKDAIYYFTRADIPRSLPENELQEQAIRAGLTGNAYSRVVDAARAALAAAAPEAMASLGGRNFVVGEAMELGVKN